MIIFDNPTSIEGESALSSEVNVLKHEMVPEHSIMSNEDVELLFSTYRISSEDLPRIYHDDPAMLAIGAKINDVIKIVRKSLTAGRAESYRLVVKRPKK